MDITQEDKVYLMNLFTGGGYSASEANKWIETHESELDPQCMQMIKVAPKIFLEAETGIDLDKPIDSQSLDGTDLDLGVSVHT